MIEEWAFTVGGDMRFSLRLFEPLTRGPVVIVPIEAVESMEDEDLGEVIRNVTQRLEYVRAISFADWIRENSGRPGRIDDFIFKEYAEKIELLRKYRGKHIIIDTVLEWIQKYEDRKVYRSNAKMIRQDMQRQYDRLFVRIGKRDGFSCRFCKATTDIQIDHIVAVINGGANDESNLQLLCKTCNRKKSDQ